MVDISGAYGKLKTWVKAQIAAHKADTSAHHAKYTDAEAVTAVATADDYIKNTGDTLIGELKIEQTSHINGLNITGYDTHNNKYADIYVNTWGSLNFEGTDTNWVFQAGFNKYIFFLSKSHMFFNAGENDEFKFRDHSSVELIVIEEATGKLNMKNHQIKNPKNHAASALSGTKKLVEMDIGGTPHYFEVYPTKA